MSSSSLKNMSTDGNVMTMPKISYRWRVRFDAFGGGFASLGLPGFGTPITANAFEVSRPKITFEDIPLHMYGTMMYMPGKPKWDPITIKIRDDSGNESTNDIAQQIRKVLDFQDMSPSINSAAWGADKAGYDFKFFTYIDMTDGGHGTKVLGSEVLEKWKLTGCYIQSVDYGPMNYASSEITNLTVTIRFDNIQQFTGKAEGNVESAVTPVKSVNSDTI